MGTRNLVAVCFQGKYPIAQYGQWDGYPEGQGSDTLEFCRFLTQSPERIEIFKQKLGKLTFITPEDLKALWVSCGASPDNDWVTMEIASKFKKHYAHLDRDAGADVLQMVYEMSETEPLKLKDSLDFAGDGLYCEWAWVIDLDKNTFEGYQGFQKEPLPDTERFAYLGMQHYSGVDSDYYPAKMVACFPLDNLPTDTEFLGAFHDEDEEELEEEEA